MIIAGATARQRSTMPNDHWSTLAVGGGLRCYKAAIGTKLRHYGGIAKERTRKRTSSRLLSPAVPVRIEANPPDLANTILFPIPITQVVNDGQRFLTKLPATLQDTEVLARPTIGRQCR